MMPKWLRTGLKSAESHPISVDVGQHLINGGPNLVEVARSRPKFGRLRTESGRSRDKSGRRLTNPTRFGPKTARGYFDQIRSEDDQISGDLERLRPSLDRHRSNLARIRPMWDTIQLISAKPGPESTPIGPIVAELLRRSAEFGPESIKHGPTSMSTHNVDFQGVATLECIASNAEFAWWFELFVFGAKSGRARPKLGRL